MKNYIQFSLVVCAMAISHSSHAAPVRLAVPVLTALKVSKPIFAPGEDLALNFRVARHGASVPNGCCVSVGLSPDGIQVFKASDGVNGLITAVGGGRFTVTHLPISYFVNSTDNLFTLMQFQFMDVSGQSVSLSADSPTDSFYKDQNEQITTIPLVTFTIQVNPNADVTPPSLSALSADQAIYHPGDVFRLNITATDARSGVEEGCCSAIGISPSTDALFRDSNAYNGHVVSRGSPQYQITNFQIRTDVDPTVQNYALTSLSLSDRAGNMLTLTQANPEDATYSDQNGTVTSLGIVRFQVLPNEAHRHKRR